MDPTKLSDTSRNILQRAQQIAASAGAVEVDTDHVLLSLLLDEGGLVPRILSVLEVAPPLLQQELERDLSRRSRKATGQVAADPAKVFLTKGLLDALDKAEAVADARHLPSVSPEALLIGITESSDPGFAGRLLKKYRVTKDRVVALIESLVQADPNRTDVARPNNLKNLIRFGRDLVSEAREGEARAGGRTGRRGTACGTYLIPKNKE